MTTMAATASICASASEAALLVASFMPFSLDLSLALGLYWARVIVAREGLTARLMITRNTPRRVFA